MAQGKIVLGNGLVHPAAPIEAETMVDQDIGPVRRKQQGLLQVAEGGGIALLIQIQAAQIVEGVGIVGIDGQCPQVQLLRLVEAMVGAVDVGQVV